MLRAMKKMKQTIGNDSCGVGSYLVRMDEEGIFEEVTFELRPKWSEAVSWSEKHVQKSGGRSKRGVAEGLREGHPCEQGTVRPRIWPESWAGTRWYRSRWLEWELDFWEVPSKGGMGPHLCFWNFTLVAVQRMNSREMWLEIRKPLKWSTQEEVRSCYRDVCGYDEKWMDLGYILEVELT